MFMWKTLIGKNHGSPRTPNYHHRRKVQLETRRQRPRALFLRQAAVATEYRSVSLSTTVYSYNNMITTTQLIQSDFPKSYLYLYELRAIYKCSLNKRTQNIFTNMSSLPVLTGSPPVSGSLPVLTGSSSFTTGSHLEGPISQQ